MTSATIAAMKTEPLSAPLRSLQHKDNFGNVIGQSTLPLLALRNSLLTLFQPSPTSRTLPVTGGSDLSTPFEASRRPSTVVTRAGPCIAQVSLDSKNLCSKTVALTFVTDTDSSAQLNRRSSYHPGSQSRFQHDSYYGGRPASLRPESTYHGNSHRNSYYENHNGHGPYSGRHRASRMHSEPQITHRGRENVYPLPHKDRSYETVTSAAGSGNSEAAGYQTDPTSSDNSSIERPSRSEAANDSGIGFNQQQPHQTQTFSVGLPSNGKHQLPSIPAGSVAQQHAPGVPQKKLSVLRRQPSQQPSETSEKRKSWFTRRFSKN
jgi:hypothetical protein